MFEWPRKSKSTFGSRGTDDTVLWIFEIFILFMFLMSGNPLLIFLQSYLENLGQLPVQGYLKGTDDCILWIFTISSLFMFSKSRNPLLTLLLSYNVWVTLKIQVNFRFEMFTLFLHICMCMCVCIQECICIYLYCLLFTLSIILYLFYYSISFSVSLKWHLFHLGVSTHISLASHWLLCLCWSLMFWTGIVICFVFLNAIKKYIDYSWFWGQEIHCWYFYIATMFRWPRKSR